MTRCPSARQRPGRVVVVRNRLSSTREYFRRPVSSGTRHENLNVPWLSPRGCCGLLTVTRPRCAHHVLTPRSECEGGAPGPGRGVRAPCTPACSSAGRSQGVRSRHPQPSPGLSRDPGNPAVEGPPAVRPSIPARFSRGPGGALTSAPDVTPTPSGTLRPSGKHEHSETGVCIPPETPPVGVQACPFGARELCFPVETAGREPPSR